MFSKLIVAEPSKQINLSENGYSDASNSNKHHITCWTNFSTGNNETDVKIYQNNLKLEITQRVQTSTKNVTLV